MQRKLINLYKEAVSAVNPTTLVRNAIQVDAKTCQIKIGNRNFPSNKNVHIVGFGKAVQAMAYAFQECLPNNVKHGVLSVPFVNPDLPLKNFEICSGAVNNLPDCKSLEATDKILAFCKDIPDEDILIVLISGGGSSLFCKPLPGLTLEDKLLTIKQLVACGATIQELNCVRKKLSAVKGGGFGATLGNKSVICLILSDIVGDPLDAIASGPTVKNEDRPGSAFKIIQKYRLELKLPRHVTSVLRENDSKIAQVSESVSNFMVGSNTIALKSILNVSEPSSMKKVYVSSSIQGLVREISLTFSEMVRIMMDYLTNREQKSLFFGKLREWSRSNSHLGIVPSFPGDLVMACEDSSTKAIILLFGGETTVEVSGSGTGGRCQELAVDFAQRLDEEEEIVSSQDWDAMLLCAGTDGIDGPTDAAGAVGSRQLIEDGLRIGLDVRKYININDCYSYLSQVADGSYLIKTGHTMTNVMDVYMLAIYQKDFR